MAWLLTRPPHNDNGKNMQSALLTIRDLKKSYLISSSLFCKQISGRFRQALAGATLTLGPGLYGLLGPNGAGKSTLIHAFFDYVMVEEPQFMEQCIQIHNIY